MFNSFKMFLNIGKRFNYFKYLKNILTVIKIIFSYILLNYLDENNF